MPLPRGLVRELKPGFVRSDDLLHFHLPHLAPSDTQTTMAQQAVAHATGCDDVEKERIRPPPGLRFPRAPTT